MEIETGDEDPRNVMVRRAKEHRGLRTRPQSDIPWTTNAEDLDKRQRGQISSLPSVRFHDLKRDSTEPANVATEKRGYVKPFSEKDGHRAETMRSCACGKETQRHNADMGVLLGDTAKTEPDRQEHCLHRSNTFSTHFQESDWKGVGKQRSGNIRKTRRDTDQEKGEPQLRIVSYNPSHNLPRDDSMISATTQR